jgi:hypothetical protein
VNTTEQPLSARTGIREAKAVTSFTTSEEVPHKRHSIGAVNPLDAASSRQIWIKRNHGFGLRKFRNRVIRPRALQNQFLQTSSATRADSEGAMQRPYGR